MDQEKVNLGPILAKILAKAVGRFEIPVENVAFISESGEVETHPAQLEFYNDTQDSAQSVTELFSSQSVPKFAIVSPLHTEISNAYSVLPKQSLISLSFTSPTTRVGVSTPVRFDTMDPDFDIDDIETDLGDMKVTKNLTLSISYDAENVEGHIALQVIGYLQTILEDPDMLQL